MRWQAPHFVPSRHQSVSCDYPVWTLEIGLLGMLLTQYFFSPHRGSCKYCHDGGLRCRKGTIEYSQISGTCSTGRSRLSRLDSIYARYTRRLCTLQSAPRLGISLATDTFRSSLLLWEYGFRTARLASSRVQPQIYDFCLFFCCFFLDFSSLFL